jgi:hypothetical protein
MPTSHLHAGDSAQKRSMIWLSETVLDSYSGQQTIVCRFNSSDFGCQTDLVGRIDCHQFPIFLARVLLVI